MKTDLKSSINCPTNFTCFRFGYSIMNEPSASVNAVIKYGSKLLGLFDTPIKGIRVRIKISDSLGTRNKKRDHYKIKCPGR